MRSEVKWVTSRVQSGLFQVADTATTRDPKEVNHDLYLIQSVSGDWNSDSTWSGLKYETWTVQILKDI